MKITSSYNPRSLVQSRINVLSDMSLGSSAILSYTVSPSKVAVRKRVTAAFVSLGQPILAENLHDIIKSLKIDPSELIQEARAFAAKMKGASINKEAAAAIILGASGSTIDSTQLLFQRQTRNPYGVNGFKPSASDFALNVDSLLKFIDDSSSERSSESWNKIAKIFFLKSFRDTIDFNSTSMIDFTAVHEDGGASIIPTAHDVFSDFCLSRVTSLLNEFSVPDPASRISKGSNVSIGYSDFVAHVGNVLTALATIVHSYLTFCSTNAQFLVHLSNYFSRMGVASEDVITIDPSLYDQLTSLANLVYEIIDFTPNKAEFFSGSIADLSRGVVSDEFFRADRYDTPLLGANLRGRVFSSSFAFFSASTFSPDLMIPAMGSGPIFKDKINDLLSFILAEYEIVDIGDVDKYLSVTSVPGVNGALSRLIVAAAPLVFRAAQPLSESTFSFVSGSSIRSRKRNKLYSPHIIGKSIKVRGLDASLEGFFSPRTLSGIMDEVIPLVSLDACSNVLMEREKWSDIIYDDGFESKEVTVSYEDDDKTALPGGNVAIISFNSRDVTDFLLWLFALKMCPNPVTFFNESGRLSLAYPVSVGSDSYNAQNLFGLPFLSVSDGDIFLDHKGFLLTQKAINYKGLHESTDFRTFTAPSLLLDDNAFYHLYESDALHVRKRTPGGIKLNLSFVGGDGKAFSSSISSCDVIDFLKEDSGYTEIGYIRSVFNDVTSGFNVASYVLDALDFVAQTIKVSVGSVITRSEARRVSSSLLRSVFGNTVTPFADALRRQAMVRVLSKIDRYRLRNIALQGDDVLKSFSAKALRETLVSLTSRYGSFDDLDVGFMCFIILSAADIYGLDDRILASLQSNINYLLDLIYEDANYSISFS